MGFFNNVSLKTRLWLIMLFMALMMLSCAGVGLIGISMANKALETTYRNSLEPTKLISRVMLLMGDNRAQVMLWLQHNSATRFAGMHNDDPLDTHVATIIRNRDEISALVAQYKQLALSREEQELAYKYTAARDRYVDEGLLPAVAALQANDYRKANEILLLRINPYYETANAQASALLQEILRSAQTRYSLAEERYILIRNAVIFSAMVCLVLCAIAATLLIRSIMRPLNRAVDHFRDISQGNLEGQITVSGRDEVGQVLEALANMQSKLKAIIGELNLLASTDRLTGSWNRRRMEEAITSEMDRLKRYGHPLCLMVLDIDLFKNINDKYGHSVGDQVLVDLVAHIKSSLRVTDSLTRWGGEEFIVLCPNTTLPTAVLLAERLRNMLARAKFSEIGNLTVSIGVAECAVGEIFAQWFKRADEALYLAKSSGRNQVQAAPEMPGRTLFDEMLAASFVQLVWNRSYESGHAVIDCEHCGLFNDANELLVAILSGRPINEVEAVAGKLTSDVIKHFQDEEAILAEVGFPGIARHAAIHRKLVNNAAALAEKIRAGTVDLGELFSFLAHDVVAKHMLGEDREFFPYLKGGCKPLPATDDITLPNGHGN